MTWKTLLKIALLIILLTHTACASKKFSTSLVLPEMTVLKNSAQFRIASVTPLEPNQFFITGYTENEYWSQKVKNSGRMDQLTADLQHTACRLYPEIFSADPSAVPLDVTVITRAYENTSVLSSFTAAVSWGLFGIILPLPLGFSCDYTLVVTGPNTGVHQEAAFRNRLSSWISFPSPLALLPVPGRAGKRACGIFPYQSRYYSGKQFTLECFVAGIVKAINQAGPNGLARTAANRGSGQIKTAHLRDKNNSQKEIGLD